ncbi:MAG: flippase-like domain-containing protein [Leptospiraceae bacterium]|nr:flippase-like domain-containing protein [Leptospiraceae bacterium]MCK6381509.1 flippase-like domain-containing protein [Leptospiraceae bacterium]NUM41127.1 flippase-like domain-containing protein [Leptospiraceae bacterium]
MKKLLVGVVTSLLAVSFLISKIEFYEFYKIKERINYFYLIPFILGSIFGLILFGARWYILLEKKMKYKLALASVILGGGANMILPARGGDILRIFYCKKESHILYPTLLSKIFIEKVVDFITVILIGLVSFFLLGINQQKSSNLAIFTFSGILVLGLIAVLLYLRYKNQSFIRILSLPFMLIRKEEFFHSKVKEHIVDLGEFLTLRAFLKPALISLFMWLCAYSTIYLGIFGLLGMQISYIEIIFLIFCGAMGVAIPSAPSGIGVFHASIISGFVLLGKTSANGLVYATILHLAQFIFYGFFALIIYVSWIWTRRHSHVNHNNTC